MSVDLSGTGFPLTCPDRRCTPHTQVTAHACSLRVKSRDFSIEMYHILNEDMCKIFGLDNLTDLRKIFLTDIIIEMPLTMI